MCFTSIGTSWVNRDSFGKPLCRDIQAYMYRLLASTAMVCCPPFDSFLTLNLSCMSTYDAFGHVVLSTEMSNPPLLRS